MEASLVSQEHAALEVAIMSLVESKLLTQQLLFVLCMSFNALADKHQELCRGTHCGTNNLICQYLKKLSSECLPGTKLINLAPHQQQILHLLNNYRNKVAAGYTKTLLPAARMARMDWSEELESLATIYVAQCATIIQPCMSSPQYTTISSIYDGVSFAGVYRSSLLPMLLEETIKVWFEDTRFVTRSMVLQLSTSLSKKMRQVALLMTDRNSHVGCSGIFFVRGLSNNFRLVCTFATDLMIDKPIYNISSPPGTHCARQDDSYENLCALGEQYNNHEPYVEMRMLDSPAYSFSQP
ncbi:tabinhibitin 2-like [Drosophila albomicans]|uniref:Tabinhibitin 2-like n=1 Tax=Drosophila albomicans TaxID=7291 RepID=A0A6P8XK25_DROAB|nr:tabinhibitin 2-like [Drosophila albomicans]